MGRGILVKRRRMDERPVVVRPSPVHNRGRVEERKLASGGESIVCSADSALFHTGVVFFPPLVHLFAATMTAMMTGPQ